MIIDAERLPSGGGEDSAVGNAVKGSRACHEWRDRGLQDSIEAVTVSVAWQGSALLSAVVVCQRLGPSRAGRVLSHVGADGRPLPICADPGEASFAALGCRTLPGALASLRVRSFRSVCRYLSYWMVPAPSPRAAGLSLDACDGAAGCARGGAPSCDRGSSGERRAARSPQSGSLTRKFGQALDRELPLHTRQLHQGVRLSPAVHDWGGGASVTGSVRGSGL